ncbi:MAG: SDR family oxidoreductase [Vampirovibrio sp.]|nr:SDR family oxidoreductase [Vampirovibrio sp.]
MPEVPLKGQIALITGAGSGIGKAIATILAGQGVNLVLNGRNHQKLTETAETIKQSHPGVEILLAPGDVTQSSKAESLITQTIDAFGRLDILINNAGISGKIALLQEISVEEIDRTLATNLNAPIYLMRSAIPVMVRQQQGVIININSIAGKTAFPYWSVYDASKFGLRAMTEAVAEEQRTNNIKVIGIYPGAVDTPIWQGIELDSPPDPKGMLTSESIANAVLFALHQPSGTYVSEVSVSPLQPAL